MVTYKSAKGRTISVGRLQVSVDTGISMETDDEVLDQLVLEGFLVKEGGTDVKATEVQVPAQAPTVEPPKGPQVITTKSS